MVQWKTLGSDSTSPGNNSSVSLNSGKVGTSTIGGCSLYDGGDADDGYCGTVWEYGNSVGNCGGIVEYSGLFQSGSPFSGCGSG